MEPVLVLSSLASVLQTELLPRCGEIAPVGQVVHENGKALLQAVLEVRDAGPQAPRQHWALFLRACLQSQGQRAWEHGWEQGETMWVSVSFALWQGIGGQASRSLMDHFAEILFALNKHCFSLLSVWIKEAMQQDGFPSARVTPEQKENFSQQILRFVCHFVCPGSCAPHFPQE